MIARILEVAKETAEKLSHASYRENAYQAVLAHLLRDDFHVRTEVGVVYRLDSGFVFGHGRVDIELRHKKTDERFLLELKANVRPNSRQHIGQLARYQHHYGKPSTGLLIYFNGWDHDIMHFVLEPR